MKVTVRLDSNTTVEMNLTRKEFKEYMRVRQEDQLAAWRAAWSPILLPYYFILDALKVKKA